MPLKAAFSAVSALPKDVRLALLQVTLYALCFQLQQPAQLYLVKELEPGSAAAGRFAQLRTLNGAVQLVGSLISGALVDRFGWNAALSLSLAASALSYGMIAAPWGGSTLLFLAQLPTVAQHAVLAVRAFVSLRAPEEFRAVWLGYVSVAYGIGFTVGPFLGGVLSGYSLRLPAALATIGSIVGLVMALQFSPTRTTQEEKREPGSPSNTSAGPGATSSRGAYATLFTLPKLRARLGLKFVFSCSLACFYSVWQVVAVDRFGLSPAASGALMSWIGVIAIVTQGLLVGIAKSWLPDRKLSILCCAGLALSFAVFATIDTATSLFALCVPLMVFSNVFQQLNSAHIAEATPDELKGAATAVDMALFSGLRMVTPAVGQALLSAGYWTVGATSSAANLLVVLLIFAFPSTVGGAAARAAEDSKTK